MPAAYYRKRIKIEWIAFAVVIAVAGMAFIGSLACGHSRDWTGAAFNAGLFFVNLTTALFGWRRIQQTKREAANAYDAIPCQDVLERNPCQEVLESAERQALKLLTDEFLDDAQREMFNTEQRFDTVGSDGKKYRISYCTAYNVSDGLDCWCAYPLGTAVADRLIAQKLLIETDVAAFKRVAFSRPEYTPF